MAADPVQGLLQKSDLIKRQQQNGNPQNGNGNGQQNGNGNGQQNGNGNGQQNGNGQNGNGNGQQNGNGNGQQNGNANPQQNGNANPQQNGNANPQQNGNANPQQNGNANPQQNGNANPQQNGNANPQQNGNANPQQNGNANPQQNGNNQPTASSNAGAIPQTAPAGGLTITQPPQTATSYYKLAQGNIITFGWNFTYLLSTPTHLTVSAICDNGNTYPVGPSDGVIPGDATSVTWDIFSYNQANPGTPLAQTTYTLNIWDDRGRDAPLAPGLFRENNALRFALYKPQPYTSLAAWNCGGCQNSSWSSYTAHPAFVSLVTTIVVMFLSGYALMRQGAH